MADVCIQQAEVKPKRLHNGQLQEDEGGTKVRVDSSASPIHPGDQRSHEAASSSTYGRPQNFDQFWMLVRPKVVSNLSVWRFLMDKTRFCNSTPSQTADQSSNVAKLNYLLCQVETLLEEVASFVMQCCVPLPSDEQEMSQQACLVMPANLSAMLKKWPVLAIKAHADLPDLYANSIFSQVPPGQADEPQDEEMEAWFSEYMAARMLKVNLKGKRIFDNDNEDDDDDDDDEDYEYEEDEDEDSDDLQADCLKQPMTGDKKPATPLQVCPQVRKEKGQRRRRYSMRLPSSTGLGRPGYPPLSEALTSDNLRKRDGSSQLIMCKACNKCFEKKKSLSTHKSKGRCPGKPEPRKLHKVIKNRYYCSHSDCLSPTGNVKDNTESFSTRSNYFKHFMERHCRDEDLVFACEVCPAKFPFLELYKQHVRTKHEKQFTCRFCGQSFAEKRTLEKHERRHTGEKPYRCDQCDFRCNSSSSLCLHKRRKHDPGEKGRVHVCELCGKGFYTRDNLKDHIATHSDIKLFSCYICGKGLKNDSCYRRHMVCVHGQKFTCEICSKDFSSKFGVDNHKREVHGILY